MRRHHPKSLVVRSDSRFYQSDETAGMARRKACFFFKRNACQLVCLFTNCLKTIALGAELVGLWLIDGEVVAYRIGRICRGRGT